MRALLDTHTFLWANLEPAKLSVAVDALLRNPASELLLSIASAWEIQIKIQKGKLTLPTPLDQMIAHNQQRYGLRFLPVDWPHVQALAGLPPAHKDPFDRMLAAQAIAEGVPLVTADPIFAQYPVTVFW